MKVKLVACFVLSCIAFASAQNNVVLFRTGIGTYSMKSQKSFQREFRTQSGIPMKNVHDFPPYLTFGFSAGIRTSAASTLGVWMDYCSTGGRLHYKDYSGMARFDQLLKAYQFGVYYQVQINKSRNWPLFATIHNSLIATRLTMTSELVLGKQSQSESLSLRSLNFSFRPGIALQKKVKVFVFQASAGFDIEAHGKMRENKKDRWFETSNGKALTAQWDGLRLSLGAGLIIGSKI